MVNFAMIRHPRLLLIFEEGVVQDLVVDVDLAHLGLHTFAHLLLKGLGGVLR